MTNKYICIHGHFYQPPRENAWLEQIEVQESAAPFHDWNERINEECYGPNAYARILNGSGKITDITNNYERISFNMGPTLLSWMELNRPETYELILEADKNSLKRFNGHGSAIAQVYNHMIMPLASKRDKDTQIKWGLYDFEKRFNRNSEGIWLAETACDTDTLRSLADNGVKYTILAPNQAKRFKLDGQWQNGINPNQPYIVNLGDNRQMVVFFYNGEVSQGVAFKGLLNDGKRFAEDLLSSFNGSENEAELLNIATDGESYGHHHRLGEMALAYCLRHIENNSDAELINYGAYIEKHQPVLEAEIH
ncbi:MAG: glycoside hydrolase, partial [Bacteroidia bacterium]